MAKIIPFPKAFRTNVSAAGLIAAGYIHAPPRTQHRSIFSILIAAIWVVIVLFLPVIKIVAVIDLFILGMRAIYFWKIPHTHAGLVFMLHAVGYLALVCFMFFYDHKKFERGMCTSDLSDNPSTAKTL